MLDLAVPEIILEYTRRTALVDQECLRSAIFWRAGTSRTIHATKGSIVVDAIAQDRKVLGGRDDYTIPEMLPVQDVVGDGSAANGSFRIVRPGRRTDDYADLEKGR